MYYDHQFPKNGNINIQKINDKTTRVIETEKCKSCGAIILKNRYSAKKFARSGIERAGAANAGVTGVRMTGAGIARADVAECQKNALAYCKTLNKQGCQGICISYDAGLCRGNRCAGCGVSAAGLCCKRYLMHNEEPNILEKDGGDYRNIMGVYINQAGACAGCDGETRRRLEAEAAGANAYRENVRRRLMGAGDPNLMFIWREYTLKDFLGFFPGIDINPVRIEMQLLIYLFSNYNLQIDLEHAHTRFHIPKHTINSYLREYFGYTYSGLLSKIRNERSKLLLRIPLLMIGEVGKLVGYKSHYHYSMIFKRYEGISPKEYRRSALDRKHNVNEPAPSRAPADPLTGFADSPV